MYRTLLCAIVVCAIGALTACGQSGALMLPSDPNYDKRSQYLLYPNIEPKSQVNETPAEQQTPSTDQN